MIRDFMLGFIKIHILHHAAIEPVYGLAMIEELRRHGYEMSPGTLYPILHALEEDGLVSREDRIVNGKVRKYYDITDAGRAALTDARTKIREIAGEVLEGQEPANLTNLHEDNATVKVRHRPAEDDGMNELIGVGDVRAAISGAEKPVVIDVRGGEEYRKGRLPGSLNIPIADLPDRMAELPRNRPIVTYCSMRHRGESRSERAVLLLRQSGLFARALEGGLPAWEAAGYSIDRGDGDEVAGSGVHG